MPYILNLISIKFILVLTPMSNIISIDPLKNVFTFGIQPNLMKFHVSNVKWFVYDIRILKHVFNITISMTTLVKKNLCEIGKSQLYHTSGYMPCLFSLK